MIERVRDRQHHRTTVAIVYGTSGEPIAVLCDAATDPPGQRWFSVVLDDASGPDGPHEAPVCVDCLLDTHPGLGHGLATALEHTGARWDGEAWQPRPRALGLGSAGLQPLRGATIARPVLGATD